MSKVYRVGIIGCGMISKVYVRNLQEKFQNTEVAAVCDHTRKNAELLAEQYNISKVLELDELLQDNEVDVVLVLTRPDSHYELVKKVLLSKRHAYVEKPIAFEVEEAKELVELAKESKVLLGCAPDTFMSQMVCRAKQIIEEGGIGEIVASEAFDLWRGAESWHENPAFFYKKGGGPMLDRGPYFLTTLLYLCGNIKSVYGMTHRAFAERTITSELRYGEKIAVEVDTHISAMYRYESGAVGTLTTSFDVYKTGTPSVEIHGTKGSLKMTTPIDFWGKLEYCNKIDGEWITVIEDKDKSAMNNQRGGGLSQMLECIGTDEQVLASGHMASMVLEIMNAIIESGTIGREVLIKIGAEE